MSHPRSFGRPTRWVIGFGFVLVFLAPAFGQQGPVKDDPTASRGKTSPRKLSDLREDEKADPAPEKTPADTAKKPAEPDPNNGFFGDPRKFSKLGGWGSFGSAMGQFGFARATLIGMPPVQEELKLTDEQKKKLKEWQEQTRKKGEEMGQKMREKQGDDPFKEGENLPIATRILQFSTMMNQVSTFMKENEDGLAKLLNSTQRKRLNQISLQMEGISALTRPEIIDSLALEDDQQQQIRQILGGMRTLQMTTWVGTMMTMRPNRNNADATKGAEPARPAENPGEDAKARAEREKLMKQKFQSMRDRSDQFQNSAVKEIINVLTRSQRAKFEMMLGPPFDPRKINNLGGPPRKTEPAAEAKTPTPGKAQGSSK